MAKIQIQVLIDDSSRLHLQDAGGVIVLRQGSHEHRTDYLLADYWLMQFVDGFNQAKNHAHGLLGDGSAEIWVDFSEDRTSLGILIGGPRVSITAGDSVFKCNIAEFEVELRKAIVEFVTHFRDQEQYDAIPSYQVLEKFIVGEE